MITKGEKIKRKFIVIVSACLLIGCEGKNAPLQQTNSSTKLVVKNELMDRIKTAQRLGNYEELIAAASNVIDQNPTAPGNYVVRAMGWMEKGRHDKAIADLNLAIQYQNKTTSDESVSLMYDLRGDCREAMGEFDAAMSDYNRAVGLDSKNADAFNGKGLLYLRKNNFDEAMFYFGEAVRLDPQRVAFRHNLEKVKREHAR